MIPRALEARAEEIVESFGETTAIVVFLAALAEQWFLFLPTEAKQASWMRERLPYTWFSDPQHEGVTWFLGQKLGELDVPTTEYAGEGTRTYSQSLTWQVYELLPEGGRPDTEQSQMLLYSLEEDHLD